MNGATMVVLCGGLAAGAAVAQTGTLDQNSPASNAGFNLDATSLTWQQQARAGIAGHLEGIRFTFTGVVGANAELNVRLGSAWSSGAPVLSTTVTKVTGATEVIFVNMTSANITLAVGDVFVFEAHGTGSGMGIQGSYVVPPGTPAYPEPLFLNTSNFADGGWRLGFQTFMLTGSTCYANCDSSTAPPVLNVQDFTCFLQKFAAGCP